MTHFLTRFPFVFFLFCLGLFLMVFYLIMIFDKDPRAGELLLFSLLVKGELKANFLVTDLKELLLNIFYKLSRIERSLYIKTFLSYPFEVFVLSFSDPSWENVSSRFMTCPPSWFWGDLMSVILWLFIFEDCFLLLIIF